MSTLTAAIREAYASVPAGVVSLSTIEVTHPSQAKSLYFVQDGIPFTAQLETGQQVTFQPCPFRMRLPALGSSGVQELYIAIDNVDQQVSDFVAAAAAAGKPVKVVYRPYLSNDTTGPQMVPPLELFLSDVTVNAVEVSGRATFADVLNKPYPTQAYQRSRFPGLGNG